METRVTLEAGPDAYIEALAVQANAKSLSQDHRLLHVFYDEIRSGSPNQFVGNGWSAETIALVHEALVRRITLLDPTYKHDSPLEKELKASLRAGLVPLMLESEYMLVRDAPIVGPAVRASAYVRSNRVPEPVSDRMKAAYGRDIELVASGDGDRPSSGVVPYHLVLLSDTMWRQIHEQERPLAVAVGTLMASVGDLAGSKEHMPKIVRAIGRLRSEVRGSTPLTAREMGRKYAARVIAGENIQSFTEIALTASSFDWEKVRDEAEEQYEKLMSPVKEGSKFRRSLRRIGEQIEQWKKNAKFKSSDEALDAARELALSEAQRD